MGVLCGAYLYLNKAVYQIQSCLNLPNEEPSSSQLLDSASREQGGWALLIQTLITARFKVGKAKHGKWETHRLQLWRTERKNEGTKAESHTDCTWILLLSLGLSTDGDILIPTPLTQRSSVAWLGGQSFISC